MYSAAIKDISVYIYSTLEQFTYILRTFDNETEKKFRCDGTSAQKVKQFFLLDLPTFKGKPDVYTYIVSRNGHLMSASFTAPLIGVSMTEKL